MKSELFIIKKIKNTIAFINASSKERFSWKNLNTTLREKQKFITFIQKYLTTEAWLFLFDLVDIFTQANQSYKLYCLTFERVVVEGLYRFVHLPTPNDIYLHPLTSSHIQSHPSIKKYSKQSHSLINVSKWSRTFLSAF